MGTETSPSSQQTVIPKTDTKLTSTRDVPFSWEDEANEAADRLMAERNETVPDMTTLMTEADAIEAALKAEQNTSRQDPKQRGKMSKKIQQKNSDTKTSETDLRGLIQETPPFNSRQSKIKPLTRFSPIKKTTTQDRSKTTLEDSSGQDDKADSQDPDAFNDSYQESFASQQEAEALRDQLDSIDRRIINMEKSVDAMMTERENLPKHIKRLQEDINSQFTTLSDRLYTAMEQSDSNSAKEDIQSTIAEVRQDSGVILQTLSQDLSGSPTVTSATAKPAPIITRKKRVQLID